MVSGKDGILWKDYKKQLRRVAIRQEEKQKISFVKGESEVNGEVVSELGFKVKRGDLIMVDGKALQGENNVYYVFYNLKDVSLH